MQKEPRDLEAQETKQDEQNQADASRVDSTSRGEVQTRRAVFGSLAAMSALLLQACADSLFTGANDKKKSREEEEEEEEDKDDKPKDDKPDDKPKDDKDDDVVGVAEECHANRINKLTAEYPETPAALQPKVVFYGNKDSTSMIAYQFGNDAEVLAVTLLAADKKILAFQPLSAADLCQLIPGQKYNAMTVDNLFLKGPEIWMVVKAKVMVGEKKLKKNFAHKITVQYFTEFDGKPVVDYSDPANVSQFIDVDGFNQLQSVARFVETAGTFWQNDKVQFPNLTGSLNRPLNTATDQSRWSKVVKNEASEVIKQNCLKGIVTDIMGNVVEVEGDFILRYQTFCSYVLQDGKYFRTTMKIG